MEGDEVGNTAFLFFILFLMLVGDRTCSSIWSGLMHMKAIERPCLHFTLSPTKSTTGRSELAPDADVHHQSFTSPPCNQPSSLRPRSCSSLCCFLMTLLVGFPRAIHLALPQKVKRLSAPMSHPLMFQDEYMGRTIAACLR